RDASMSYGFRDARSMYTSTVTKSVVRPASWASSHAESLNGTRTNDVVAKPNVNVGGSQPAGGERIPSTVRFVNRISRPELALLAELWSSTVLPRSRTRLEATSWDTTALPRASPIVPASCQFAMLRGRRAGSAAIATGGPDRRLPTNGGAPDAPIESRRNVRRTATEATPRTAVRLSARSFGRAVCAEI